MGGLTEWALRRWQDVLLYGLLLAMCLVGSATPRAAFADPIIGVDPDHLSDVLAQGDTDLQNLTISNTNPPHTTRSSPVPRLISPRLPPGRKNHELPGRQDGKAGGLESAAGH